MTAESIRSPGKLRRLKIMGGKFKSKAIRSPGNLWRWEVEINGRQIQIIKIAVVSTSTKLRLLTRLFSTLSTVRLCFTTNLARGQQIQSIRRDASSVSGLSSFLKKPIVMFRLAALVSPCNRCRFSLTVFLTLPTYFGQSNILDFWIKCQSRYVALSPFW